MNNHRRCGTLPIGERSIGYFSNHRPDRLVIFVHGLTGSSSKTWKDFPELMLASPRCATCDLIFVGYDSVWTTAEGNTDMLFDGIADLVSGKAVPSGFSGGGLARPRVPTYASVLLVGHSLGAVISRKALLKGLRSNLSWARDTTLFFFAPAHCGAVGAFNVAMELVTGLEWKAIPVGMIAAGVTRFKCPVVDDLMQETPFLANMKKETERALAADYKNARAFRVFFGGLEKFVNREEFVDGEQFETNGYLKSTHQSICKASKKFLQPYTDVMKVL